MYIIRNHISWYLYRLHQISKPKDEYFKPSDKDVYLVSYPRSGNTWMRVLLAEIIYGESGESLRDLGYYMPDINKPRLMKNVIEVGCHYIKAHDPLMINRRSELFKKVLYIIRDPRDIVISWFRFQSGRLYHKDFNHFFLDWISDRIYPSSWQTHVNSWTGPGIDMNDVDVCVVRYEDLLKDAFSVLKKIMTFLDLDVEPVRIREGIKKASVDKMRRKEKLGFWEDNVNLDKLQFIGPATSNQWQKILTEEQVNLIFYYSGNEMKRFGYL